MGKSLANSIKKVKDISIALYKADSTYNDSIVFKEKPLYVTNTKDTTLFAFNHIKEGAYKIIALEDKDKNFTYQPKKDRIAFIDSIIHLPSDALLSMKIFKEIPALQFLRPKLINQGKIELGFQGNLTNKDCFKINSFPSNEYIIQPIKAKDSLHIWIKDSAYDSLTIDITKGLKARKYTLKAKKKERDSLNVKLENSSVLDLTDTVRLALSTPVGQLEKSKFLLLEKDSIETSFDVFTDQYLNKVFVQFNKNPKSSYTLTVLPGAIHDFFGDQNKDSIQSTFKIPSEEEYDLSLTIPNEEGKDLIVYLTDEKKTQSQRNK